MSLRSRRGGAVSNDANAGAITYDVELLRARVAVLETQLSAARRDRDEAVAFRKKVWQDRGLTRLERMEDKSLRRTASKAVLKAARLRSALGTAREAMAGLKPLHRTDEIEFAIDAIDEVLR